MPIKNKVIKERKLYFFSREPIKDDKRLAFRLIFNDSNYRVVAKKLDFSLKTHKHCWEFRLKKCVNAFVPCLIFLGFKSPSTSNWT